MLVIFKVYNGIMLLEGGITQSNNHKDVPKLQVQTTIMTKA